MSSVCPPISGHYYTHPGPCLKCNVTTTPSPPKQKRPSDFILNINNVNINFATRSYDSIDNLDLDIFRPNPGFELYTLADGNQLISRYKPISIHRVLRICFHDEYSILCVVLPNEDNYFLKSDGMWREIDYFEYSDKLNQARSIIPIKEISIDTSSLIKREGLVMAGYKYGSTYQYGYKADLGYVARSVRYGDYVIWKAEDDTERCIAATIFLTNYYPVGMTALILRNEVQIAYYKFENNRWEDVHKNYYMNMVRSHKPSRGYFEIKDHQHDFDIVVHLCPKAGAKGRSFKKSCDGQCDSSEMLADDAVQGKTPAEGS